QTTVEGRVVFVGDPGDLAARREQAHELEAGVMLDADMQQAQVLIHQMLQAQVTVVENLLLLAFITAKNAVVEQADQQFGKIFQADAFLLQFLFNDRSQHVGSRRLKRKRRRG